MKTLAQLKKNTSEVTDNILDLGFDLYDYCHQQADSDSRVIYYSEAWDLVCSVRDWDLDLFEEAEQENQISRGGTGCLTEMIAWASYVMTRMHCWSPYEVFHVTIYVLMIDSYQRVSSGMVLSSCSCSLANVSSPMNAAINGETY